MLGVVLAKGRSGADALLAAVAGQLADDGWALAGALQTGTGPKAVDEVAHAQMDLAVLPDGPAIRISQIIGAPASGCRLDPSALEQVVGLVEASFDARHDRLPALLVVNKFGRQEAAGRGFRPLIGRALAQGVPVLTVVSPAHLTALRDFGGGLEHLLAPDAAAILAWCRTQR